LLCPGTCSFECEDGDCGHCAAGEKRIGERKPTNLNKKGGDEKETSYNLDVLIAWAI
jgi:hypothetical protein